MTLPIEPPSAIALDIRVLELLVSRICHDLVSPVGAVNNGTELIEELGSEMVDQALDLISQSGRQAAGRLQCFRVAYGAAGGRSSVGVHEIHDLARGWMAGGRAALDWHLSPADMPAESRHGMGKVLLNLVLLADEVLIHGGKVEVRMAEEETGGVTVAAEGRTVALGDARQAALEGIVSADELTPRTVHAYVTGLFARRYGFGLAVSQPAPDRLRLELVP
jgi:histidine phosphotransferase ChpT